MNLAEQLAGQLPYFSRIGLAGLCGILMDIERNVKCRSPVSE